MGKFIHAGQSDRINKQTSSLCRARHLNNPEFNTSNSIGSGTLE